MALARRPHLAVLAGESREADIATIEGDQGSAPNPTVTSALQRQNRRTLFQTMVFTGKNHVLILDEPRVDKVPVSALRDPVDCTQLNIA
jgi:hypothetical protein